jgi:hypothetical protein
MRGQRIRFTVSFAFRMPFADEPITDLLRAWRAGDESARDAVMEAVY